MTLGEQFTVWSLRAFAFAAGLFFVGCEAFGTFEFLTADQGGKFNYIVAAGTGVAIVTGILPVYAGIAWKQRLHVLALVAWLAVPLALTVVYYAAIQRTGGAADKAEVERLRTTRVGTLAARTEKDATEAWEVAKEAARVECTTGPARQQRGPKCLEAETKRDAAWTAVLRARDTLKTTPETQPDSGARRVVAMVPWVTEAQVQLYQPMVIPVVMSVLASLFMSFATMLRVSPKAIVVAAPAPEPAPVSHPVQVDVIEPPRALPQPAPQRLLQVHDEAAAVIKEMADILTPAGATCQLEIEDFYNGHSTWRRAAGLAPVSPQLFVDCAGDFCKAAGVKTRTRGNKVFLVGVQLANDDEPQGTSVTAAPKGPT